MEFKNILSKKEKTQQPKEKADDLFSVSAKGANKKKGNFDSDLNLNVYGTDADNDSAIGTVNDIFLNALMKKASDIHIEPREKELKIRFRVDGYFIAYKDFPAKQKESILARIKIMSYLRIDEHRQPQDGKINYRMFGGKSIDMRVSVLPTIYGEKCVIRLLNKDEKPPELSTLGIMPYNMVRIKKHLADNFGMILAVGPTGSGKSTTLFSMLSTFNANEKNISTLEDPVEYRIDGVNHTQIQPIIDFTFAKGLRSLLRQDPDVIMVGEVRDEETAKLAVEASITGHVVFSTLHTNSAVHTIQRLINLGVDPLLISSSLRIIISQRLARKLCIHCKVAYRADEKIERYIIGEIGRYIKKKENLKLYKAKAGGCEKCNSTGYKGRIGLYEVLEMSDKIEQLMLKNASRTQLEIQAVGDGMVPIKEDALLKVVLGETSIEEILTALGH